MSAHANAFDQNRKLTIDRFTLLRDMEFMKFCVTSEANGSVNITGRKITSPTWFGLLAVIVVKGSTLRLGQGWHQASRSPFLYGTDGSYDAQGYAKATELRSSWFGFRKWSF